MDAHLTFTAIGHPQTAGSKRAFKTKSGKLIVADDNPKSKGWQGIVADTAAEIIRTEDKEFAVTGPLLVRMTFHTLRPKGHYNSKGALRPAAPAYPDKRPDLLKWARAVEDALTGVVWRDDAQIVEEPLAKRYADEGTPERVEVEITRLAPTVAATESLRLVA